MKYSDELPDEIFVAVYGAKQVYAEERINLGQLKIRDEDGNLIIKDNPLEPTKLIGNINAVIGFGQNAEVFLLLETLGLNSGNPLMNYEPNYLQAIVNHSTEVALSVQVDLIIQDIKAGFADPRLYDSIMGGDTTGGSH